MTAVAGPELAPRDPPWDGLLWKTAFAPPEAYPAPDAATIGIPIATKRRKVKKRSEQQIIGQRGVHLLSGRLLAVGLSFQPTGALDAGIDGFLELRDPATGEVRAQWISAQLKTKKDGK